MTAGEAIRAWREYRGMSQYQLSEETGIHRAQIGAWEAERHSPTFDSMEKLAGFFDVDVLGFLSGPTAPEAGARPDDDLIHVALFENAGGLMDGQASGAYRIPADLRGCVAMRVTDSTHGWRQAGPEVRKNDVWAVRPGGKPREGMMVLVHPNDKGDSGQHVAVGVWRQRLKVVDSIHPAYPSVSADEVKVVAVAEALLWRDYRKGLRR
jgi:transcriptional regulator with XRE-family HTH domain